MEDFYKKSPYKGKNDEGKYLTGPKELLDESFGNGEFDDEGEPEVTWPEIIEGIIDRWGFDERNRESNGRYKIPYTIPKGTIIIRYGTEAGTYTAPENTPYEQLSLPYKKETVPFNKYRVLTDDFTVIAEYEGLRIDEDEYTIGHCVIKGIVAPAFNSPGGAVQYKHFKRISYEVEHKLLERLEI